PLPADGIVSRKLLADLNQDGILDLAFTDECSIYVGPGFRYPNGGLTFGSQQSDGSYSMERIPVRGLGASDSVGIADVNGDGVLDLVAYNYDPLRVWYGTGARGGLPSFSRKASSLPILSDGPDSLDSCWSTLVRLDGDSFLDRIDYCASDGMMYF